MRMHCANNHGHAVWWPFVFARRGNMHCSSAISPPTVECGRTGGDGGVVGGMCGMCEVGGVGWGRRAGYMVRAKPNGESQPHPRIIPMTRQPTSHFFVIESLLPIVRENADLASDCDMDASEHVLSQCLVYDPRP